MILVTVGTQDKPFNRLIKKIDEMVKKGIIKDQVIMQVGYTPYEGTIEHFSFVSETEMNKLMKKADLIICHAGVGTILNALDLKKKVIVVPRLKKYEEHMNDHQLQITKEIEKLGIIKSCSDLKNLDKTIASTSELVPRKIKLDTDAIVETIDKFIAGVE